jgi:C1A family cysteine protease
VGCVMLAVRKKLAVVAVAVTVLGFHGRVDAKPPTKQEVQNVNAVAAKLFKLDEEARERFAKDHPGVLPDSRLHLPKATAVAFDWCNLNMVSQAHHQRTGDCWANAATEALECSNIIRNGRRYIFSPQPVLDHLKLGAAADEMGAQPGLACGFFLKIGTARLADYTYTGKPAEPKDVPLPYRAVAWGYVSMDNHPPSAEQLKEALLKHGPLVVDLTDTTKFNQYAGGLFSEPGPLDKKDIRGKHVVLLVGWDDTRGEHGAWKIKNSWRPTWGEQGFMWIDRTSNDIARHAEWVCAASSFYRLPQDDFARLVPEASALPVAHTNEPANSGTRERLASTDL